ncbi:MAG: MFS transporter [bacterium]|nr:MFS transporter [bacterium]
MIGSVKEFGQRTFVSLKTRNYRLYFWGQAISVAGTWMQTVALGWFVLQFTGSGAQLGSVVATSFVPLLVFGPLGGVIADRFEKRRVILYAQSAFVIQALSLSILVYSGLTQVWMLYALAFFYGLIRAVDEPTRQAFVLEMVDDSRMKNAVSLNSMVNNLARIVGPMIGGVLIVGMGVAFCFLFNALSYIAVISMILIMDKNELRRGDLAAKAKQSVADGFRFILATPLIKDILIMMAIVGTFAYEWQVSLPLLAERTFNGDASSYTFLMSSFGIGAVIGGLFSASRHRLSSRSLVIYVFVFGLSIIATALMPTLQLAMLGMVLVGFFSINLTTLANTMLQLESTPEMRGRVMSFWIVAMLGSTTIGGPAIGFIGEYFGARWGLLVGGLAALIAASTAGYPLLKKNTVDVIPESDEPEVEGIPAGAENQVV